MQLGPTCGYYAVACATMFFKPDALPARKGDCNPKASASLREMRTELGIPGKGEIFATQHLEKLIAKTSCKSLVCDINTFQQFMDVIKQATEQNLPIIIPFASDLINHGEPSQSSTAEGAHWATIIGWIENTGVTGVLLAQYGRYFAAKADELFTAFYEIEPIFPERYLYKQKGCHWNVSVKPVEATAEIETATIPQTNLKEDFCRKLVVVFPSEYDVSLFNTNKTLLLKPQN